MSIHLSVNSFSGSLWICLVWQQGRRQTTLLLSMHAKTCPGKFMPSWREGCNVISVLSETHGKVACVMLIIMKPPFSCPFYYHWLAETHSTQISSKICSEKRKTASWKQTQINWPSAVGMRSPLWEAIREVASKAQHFFHASQQWACFGQVGDFLDKSCKFCRGMRD